MRLPFLRPLLFTGALWAVPACGFAEADLATWLASKPGALHAAPEHPWLQEVTFNTRLHRQYAWVSGRSGGNDFWYESGGEVRRFYFGPTVRFLDLFTLKADVVHPHLKLMTGIEWERMENSATGTTVYDGITGWLARRIHF